VRSLYSPHAINAVWALLFRRDGALPNICLDVAALKTELFPDAYSVDLSIFYKPPERGPADIKTGHDIFSRQQFFGAGVHLGVILFKDESLSNIA